MTSSFTTSTPVQLAAGSYPGSVAATGSTGGSGSYPGLGSGNGGYPGPSGGHDGGGYPIPASGLPLKYLCSNDVLSKQGSDILKSTALELKLIDPSGNVACDVTNGIRDQVLNKVLNLSSDCPNLTGNSYRMTLTDPNANSGDLFADNALLQYSSIQLTRKDASSPWMASGISNGRVDPLQAVYVLYDSNNSSDSACDRNASPLMIDVQSDDRPDADMLLSSPADGVLFDILGANSFPSPYTKRQISWVRNPSEYMFLALPNGSGQVLGVDQLFGNNTLGPDGKFAANGFAALAKYDSNGDGVIDNRDAVFSQLRLWSDKNVDGVATADELLTLDQVGITQINLKYNPRFKEQDPYGNQFRYSSQAIQKGQPRMVFDVWFLVN